MKLAIHTVFILKENILFLEEWICYHILLGFNKFYLYDNSKVMISGGCHPNHKCFKPGKINKYGSNYEQLVNMSELQMKQYIQNLCEKYKCVEIIEWAPRDKSGNVLHKQKDAHNHCLKILKRDKIDWCANIDMDEYIVMKDFDNIEKYILSLPTKIKNIKMGQTRFDSRFNHLDKLVTDINECENEELDRNHSNKNIYNVDNTVSVDIHSIVMNKMNSNKEYKPSTKEIWFNHYKLTQNNYKHVNNLNASIKTKLNECSFISKNMSPAQENNEAL